jgi:ubiquinone/menaquinone biosynthesis C-methylase UbiE
MTVPTWFLDELAFAGPEHLDDEYVAAYDAKALTDWQEELRTLQAIGLNERSVLVDLGAGTGGLALAAAPHCRRVVAADISPAMLAVIRARAEAAGLTNLETAQAGLLSYEHSGEPADLVYSRHALHHLPDHFKAIALHRIAGFMQPGGVFRLRDLIFSCPLSEAVETIEAWLGRASTTPGVGWNRAELETHLREEYSTFSWLLEPMLLQAGFRIESAGYDRSRIYADYTCVKTG